MEIFKLLKALWKKNTPQPRWQANGEKEEELRAPDFPRRIRSDKITSDLLDPDALKVIDRLKQFSHEAYFVGGCVRDLLLGKTPKDFDVATSASPRQIRGLFKNSRIIGRRFRLAHIYFRRKIIETATFRKGPEGQEISENPKQDLLITDDNLFGTAEEDAKRRDFTINALFYDPQTQEVIDYVEGYQDLEQKMIQTIGDPSIRFREDPVRIIRAIRFATRLGFSIEESAFVAMKESSADLSRSAGPRILEELLRLLRSGHSAESFRLLRKVGGLGVLLPQIEQFLSKEETSGEEGQNRVRRFWRYLEALDERVLDRQTPSTSLALACLFIHIYRWKIGKSEERVLDLGKLVAKILSPLAQKTRLPRYDLGRIQRICVAQRRFTQRPGRRFRPNHFVRQDYFPDALQLFRIHSLASGLDPKIYERWLERRQKIMDAPFPTAHRKEAQRRPFPPRAYDSKPSRPSRRADPPDSDPYPREEEKDPTWGDW